MAAGAGILALMGLSTGISAISAFSGAKDQQRQLRIQAEVMRRNARLLNRRVGEARQSGRRAEQTVGRNIENIKGSQKAAFAGSGFTFDGGGPLDILSGTDLVGAVDKSTVRRNTATAIEDLQIAKQNADTQGQMLQYQADRIDPFMAFGLTAVTGAARTGAAHLNFQRLQPDQNFLFLGQPGAGSGVMRRPRY